MMSAAKQRRDDDRRRVRVTVDLDAAIYDELRDWAHDARMSHADVLRTLVRLLTSDQSLGRRVRDLGHS